jgi:hypothetical protein
MLPPQIESYPKGYPNCPGPRDRNPSEHTSRTARAVRQGCADRDWGGGGGALEGRFGRALDPGLHLAQERIATFFVKWLAPS